MMKTLLGVGLALCLGVFALLVLSSATQMQLESPVQVIGQKTPIQVRIDNPHGVRRLTAVLEQGGNRYTVYESSQPSNRLTFWRKKIGPQQISFAAGRERAPQLKEGKARLIIEATGNDFRGSTAELAQDVEVNTRPPRVTADGFQHYINQGGAELVVFTVSGYWTEAGVRIGKYEFRSFPMPGSTPKNGQEERFSLFAFPWDVPADTAPVVYARNPSGAEARAQFWFKVFPKKFRSRDLEINDTFLQKVTDDIDPQGSGDLLQRFLKINGEMRRANNQTLYDLRLKTADKFLWSGPFYRYGKTESFFADSRTYIYKGKAVDHQTHLGFDLSDVQHAPVVAANDGQVVHADRLGIYGNCIVVDHGYGLQSIYGHLSQIDVKVGDMVKKGQKMGLSGATGLAGGDHLHFSMQVDGVQVTPIEWWDEHWIHDRVLAKISANAQTAANSR